MPAPMDPNIHKICFPLHNLIKPPEIDLRHRHTNPCRAREVARNHWAEAPSETAVRCIQRICRPEVQSEVLERAVGYTPAACGTRNREGTGIGWNCGAVAAEAADGVPDWGGEEVGRVECPVPVSGRHYYFRC